MSSSAKCREFSGRKLQKKPSFSQTCSRLSRYLKEKGSFGDLCLGMTCNPDVNGVSAVSCQPTMMNLFPCEEASSPQGVKPTRKVPRQSSFSSSSSSGAKEEVEKIIETKSVKVAVSQSAPLTIFYGGQVMVFDDFPAEKAKQVIDLAQNIAKNQKEIASTTTNTSSLACELPIARRASLHRFLEKRKDRITSKAPYQIDGSAEASSKPNTSWLGSQ